MQAKLALGQCRATLGLLIAPQAQIREQRLEPWQLALLTIGAHEICSYEAHPHLRAHFPAIAKPLSSSGRARLVQTMSDRSAKSVMTPPPSTADAQSLGQCEEPPVQASPGPNAPNAAWPGLSAAGHTPGLRTTPSRVPYVRHLSIAPTFIRSHQGGDCRVGHAGAANASREARHKASPCLLSSERNNSMARLNSRIALGNSAWSP